MVNWFDSVTSEDICGNQRGLGRSGVLAGVASGLNRTWRLEESESGQYRGQVGAPLGEQRGRRIDAGKVLSFEGSLPW